VAVAFDVTEYIKGDGPDAINLIFNGTTNHHSRVDVVDAETYDVSEGKEYILFLREASFLYPELGDKTVYHSYVGGTQGKYSVIEGEAIPVFPHQPALTIDEIRTAAGD
jgi:hypothetical protein